MMIVITIKMMTAIAKFFKCKVQDSKQNKIDAKIQSNIHRKLYDSNKRYH